MSCKILFPKEVSAQASIKMDMKKQIEYICAGVLQKKKKKKKVVEKRKLFGTKKYLPLHLSNVISRGNWQTMGIKFPLLLSPKHDVCP